MKTVRWLSGFALAMVVGPALAADPQIKTITQPKVEVRSGPSAQYYPTAVLNKGDVVTVLDLKNGFLEIKPPDGSFDWVNAGDLEVHGATANVRRASDLRVGSAIDPVKNVGIAIRKVVPGTQLSLLPDAPMKVETETLVKVRPPIDDVRYIPADAIVEWTGAQPQPTATNVPAMPPSFVPDNTQSTATPAFGPSNAQPRVVPTLGQQPNSANWETPAGQTNSQTGSAPGEGRKHSRPGAAQGSNEQVAQTGSPPAYGPQDGQLGAAGSYGLQNSTQGMAAKNGQQYVPPS
ncbi:MAG TPA: SH3 domain-containing protein, partial [Gemmataceae bacterium]|nr:SH3 domain-containing protein [Gemmataceae bacterium]